MVVHDIAQCGSEEWTDPCAELVCGKDGFGCAAAGWGVGAGGWGGHR